MMHRVQITASRLPISFRYSTRRIDTQVGAVALGAPDRTGPNADHDGIDERRFLNDEVRKLNDAHVQGHRKTSQRGWPLPLDLLSGGSLSATDLPAAVWAIDAAAGFLHVNAYWKWGSRA
jgi:hypothetical protein